MGIGSTSREVLFTTSYHSVDSVQGSLSLSLSLKIPRGMRNAHLSKLWTVLNISSCTTVVKPPPTLLQKQKRKKNSTLNLTEYVKKKNLSFFPSVDLSRSWLVGYP